MPREWRLAASLVPSARRRRAARQSSASGAVSQDTVLQVQQKLHDLGFYVRDNIDGQWGPRTQSAVQNFQRGKGIAPSGQLDVQTLTALGLGGDNQAASGTAPNVQ